MLKNKLQYVLVIFCFFLFSSHSFSQEKDKRKTLFKDILQSVENKYNVKFSYVEESIANIYIEKPKTTFTLKDIISYLERTTFLVFDKIDNVYYTISKRKGMYICGEIKNKFSSEEIIGATIQISSSNEGTISDEDGFFSYENVPEGTNLRVRALGYEEIVINANSLAKPPCSTIYLYPKNEVLDEIVVQKYLTSGIIKEKNGNVVINTVDYGILPGLIEPDVLQTIQALPGVESVNERVSNINMRGGTNDQNLLLWDNIKMYQSGHFFGLISAFNPYLTKNVSVIRNGTSASLGDGVSSTIDMRSHDKVEGSFKAGMGLNLISGDAFAYIPVTNRFGIQFSARRSMTDFLKTPTYNRYFERVFQDSKITNQDNISVTKNTEKEERFFFYDTSAKLLYDFNKNHKIRASIIHMNNDLEYEESLSGFERIETKTSTLQQKNIAFGGSFSSKWSSRFSTELQAYYTNYNLESVNFNLLTSQKLIVTNEILETGTTVKSNYTINNRLNFGNGYQFYEIGITNLEDVNAPIFRRKIKDVIRYHALFSELEYESLDKKTFFRVGARLNYIDKFSKVIVEPRLNFQHKFENGFAVEFKSETKNQVTSQIVDLQRDFLGVEKRKWILSDNKDFPITKSQQISLGFNVNQPSFYAGIEGFYKRIEGITTSNQSFFNQNQFQRTIGSYDIQGVELLVNKKSSKYSTWLSYTASKNTYTFDAINPKNFSNNLDVCHSLSFAGTYMLNNFKVALGVNWRSGRPFTKPLVGNEVTELQSENRINYETPNSSNLPNYLRTDFSSTYTFKFTNTTKATIGFAVLNVLDRKNTLDIYYRLPEAKSTKIEQVENMSLGITPNVSFRVFF